MTTTLGIISTDPPGSKYSAISICFSLVQNPDTSLELMDFRFGCIGERRTDDVRV